MTKPINPYESREAEERNRPLEGIDGFIQEHRVSLLKGALFTGLTLLAIGTILLSMGSVSHGQSDLETNFQAGGTCLAILGLAMTAFAFHKLRNSKSEQDEETPLLNRFSRGDFFKYLAAFAALIAIVGVTLSASGGSLDDHSAINLGIGFAVVGGVAAVASILNAKRLQKIQKEMEA